jgi:hypothetical protein
MLGLNIWVWLFPKYFVKFVKLGKGAKIESVIPSLKEIWQAIEHPRYIWGPRLAFGILLAVALVMAYTLHRP